VRHTGDVCSVDLEQQPALPPVQRPQLTQLHTHTARQNSHSYTCTVAGQTAARRRASMNLAGMQVVERQSVCTHVKHPVCVGLKLARVDHTCGKA
jgi:hypothetical protein